MGEVKYHMGYEKSWQHKHKLLMFFILISLCVH